MVLREMLEHASERGVTKLIGIVPADRQEQAGRAALQQARIYGARAPLGWNDSVGVGRSHREC